MIKYVTDWDHQVDRVQRVKAESPVFPVPIYLPVKIKQKIKNVYM